MAKPMTSWALLGPRAGALFIEVPHLTFSSQSSIRPLRTPVRDSYGKLIRCLQERTERMYSPPENDAGKEIHCSTGGPCCGTESSLSLPENPTDFHICHKLSTARDKTEAS